jgi:nucleoside-diphosphate-sugar epimerase
MDLAAEILMRMRAAAASGLPMGGSALRELQAWTQELLAVRSTAAREEYARFLAIGRRSLAVSGTGPGAWVGGKTVLVTGGTGCIGSSLMALMARWHPGRLISVSRGVTGGWPQPPGVSYQRADIRDRRRLDCIIRETRPDVIFHLAAERDTGLAEREVHRAVSTNVLGTRNVLAAAAEYGVSQVVLASTGKALRPYSPLVYTASKRAAEWLASCAALRGGPRCSAARFTHVVNNSNIHRRLLEWCDGGMIRLHGADIVFYAQSAVESAQLLLCGGLAVCDGEFLVHAVTDLGWPVSLLDLALGARARTRSSAPIVFIGPEQGYETEQYPGLYDPVTAGDVSPLMSIFEACRAKRPAHGAADAFPLEFAADPEPEKRFQALEDVCTRTEDPETIRRALDQLSWSLLDAALQVVPTEVLARAMKLASPHQELLNPDNHRLQSAIVRNVVTRSMQSPNMRICAPGGH